MDSPQWPQGQSKDRQDLTALPRMPVLACLPDTLSRWLRDYIRDRIGPRHRFAVYDQAVHDQVVHDQAVHDPVVFRGTCRPGDERMLRRTAAVRFPA